MYERDDTNEPSLWGKKCRQKQINRTQTKNTSIERMMIFLSALKI